MIINPVKQNQNDIKESKSSKSPDWFDPDKDYSEAIANTTDSAERKTLLFERQNKINTQGLAGKVSDNDAVASWHGDYRPYSSGKSDKGSSVASKSSPGWKSGVNNLYSSDSLVKHMDALYEAAEAELLSRFDTARKQNNAWLNTQYANIEKDYEKANTDTQNRARLTALGSEEKLAALGLNMGGAYDIPTTGYAESSRIRQDNNLHSALNELSSARLAARDSAAQTAAQNETSLAGQQAAEHVSLLQQRAQSVMAQYNADRNFEISKAGLTGFLGGTPTLNYQKYQADLQQNALDNALLKQKFEAENTLRNNQQEQQKYENALERWKMYGYVLAGDADILGVPVGTPTSDTRYKNAFLPS